MEKPPDAPKPGMAGGVTANILALAYPRYLPIIAPVTSAAVRLRSAHGFKDTNSVAPLDLNDLFSILIPEIRVICWISGKSLRKSASISSNTDAVRLAEAPSGNVTPAKNIPLSSVGINPLGFTVNI